MDQYLHSKIESGEWAPGTYIPSESELTQTFKLSRPSVRKAVGKLAEEGLVRTIHGAGSVVCDPAQTSTNLYMYWGMPSYEYETMKALIDRFNQANPHIHVELVKTPREALGASAKDGFQVSGKRTDLIGMSNTFFYQLVDENPKQFLRPLHLDDLSPFSKPHIRAFTHKGRLLAAPISFAPIVLVYNKSMFDAAGLAYPESSWSWQELLQAARALTRIEGDQTEQYGFSFSASPNRWPLFVLQNGGSFRSGDGDEPLTDDPASQEALQFAIDLMYKHKVAPVFATENFRLGELLFLREKVGMILTSYVFLEEFSGIDFEWDYIRFPGEVPDSGLSLATGIGISTQCEAVDEANQLIQYLISEEAQSYIKQHVCSIPVRTAVAEDRSLPHSPLAGYSYYLFESLKDNLLTVMDFGLSYKQLTELNQELGLVWANVASVDEVWNRLRDQWKRI